MSTVHLLLLKSLTTYYLSVIDFGQYLHRTDKVADTILDAWAVTANKTFFPSKSVQFNRRKHIELLV